MNPDAHEIARDLIKNHAAHAELILDVGCGSGSFVRQIADELHATPFGIDPFIADQDSSELHLRALPAEALSRLGRRFDLIYSVHSMHHFNNVHTFFHEVQKTLGWSGVVILVDWKHGARTGIPERYYRLGEVLRFLENYNFKLIDYGEAGDNFYLVATLRERCLAVATDEQGKTVFPKMFGQAPFFDLYLFKGGTFRFLEKRKNIFQKTLQHEKTLDVYDEVSECQALLARSIGRKGQQRLKDKGVRMFFATGEVEKAFEGIIKNNK